MSRETPPDTRGLAGRYLLALAAAAIVMPIFVLVLRTPVWAGLAGALFVFVGLALFAVTAAPGAPRVRVQSAGRQRVLDAVVNDAGPALDRVEAVIEALPRNAVRDRLDRIAEVATRVLKEIEAEPARLASAQRLLTYYLPRTAEIAEGYLELRKRNAASAERVAAIEEVLAKTEQACVHFAQRVVDDDMRSLDAEIKLVKDALKEDLG
jgi:hypothetical protein